MKVLAIIPARGGSKGVPGKNIKEFDGTPLLAYAIKAGKESNRISELVVNTEDPKIAEIAEKYDCQVVFRKKEFAKDESPVLEAVKQTLDFFEAENRHFDAVLLLQPTSPLRTGHDIDEAVKLLDSNADLDAVISMVKVGDQHPARMYKLEEGRLKSLFPKYETENRQHLPDLYLRNGCIYLIRTEALKKYHTLMPEKKAAYVMDSQWAVNVDTEMDVLILEQLVKKWKKENR